MKRLYETGAHPFLWQDGMRQDCIHFYDKIVWDRHSSIFMTRWHETGLHSFLWQDCMRPALIHFIDKMAWDRTAFIFMTSQHKTGTHPFYIGMYIHIYTHIYVHIYTSQKECLHIFQGPAKLVWKSWTNQHTQVIWDLIILPCGWLKHVLSWSVVGHVFCSSQAWW